MTTPAYTADAKLLFGIAKFGLLGVMLAMLGGCGSDYSPDTYASTAVQQANKVEPGIVVGVRQVDVTVQPTTGAVVGGAAGGIAGSQVPGGGVSRAFGALGGTLVGGLVGATVEHTAGDTEAFEYIVHETKGDLVSVTQQDSKPLTIGEKVLVIAGSQARVVPDYTVPVQTEPSAAAAQDKPVPLPSSLPELPPAGLTPAIPASSDPVAAKSTPASPAPATAASPPPSAPSAPAPVAAPPVDTGANGTATGTAHAVAR
jgi:outer membrane lipoprotein SlyB